ncbi:ribosomal-protein-alanine N-acetyltransferase [Saccharolobus solfataricus]|uniref:N-terminal acetyltransferase complex ard1 subunit n=3 Tax=Saccharolobus solfataricus TaxID=2287 RepID=Q7LXZ8_SACS2|nr:ribosomal protein S18-alanine N-acetyltransferase [Saccharolobus solfataricus]AAK40442.1 N-terminal acetyltransferase complex ard1 subunit [Saccharolobus solfataricus P2]AKA73428.1 ribosomal-protein-alanine N-acetyltransferase [Saccharolobus solfataricus]AKA76126.1 ribosomal-protein-alanine N-acetyltransferase [Saccharolobus solfataricus]AKA78818.1 ribosomal-protein-alanine N-acetyltransferase [Saccharolobus solfataricus]AZF67893.1 ribosomal-protein-alanine N-acetyltransferase [Saccharolobu
MVIITDATEADLDQIFQIETESFEDPYPYSLLRAYLFLANKLYLVAKQREKVVGYIIGIIQYGYRGHIVSIAVEPIYRKQGIGAKLLNEIEERFKLNGARYSYLEVNTNNLSAISFYRANGYLIMYVRKNYYGRDKHAFVMVKNLYYKYLD